MVCDIFICLKLGVQCSPTFPHLSKAWAPSVPLEFSRDFSKCLMITKTFTQVRVTKNIKMMVLTSVTQKLMAFICCSFTEAWFLFLTTSRWFAVRLDGICSIFVVITAFGCLFLRDGTVCVIHYWHIGLYEWNDDEDQLFNGFAFTNLQDLNQEQWVWLCLMLWRWRGCSSGASDRARKSRTWWEK